MRADAGEAPTASVVICTYARERLPRLRRALEEAAGQLLPDDELIVVVDHDDALLPDVAALAPAARVVANRHARGLSGARDTGVEAAAGDLVVFLDDDAVPRAGWLAHLRAAFADPAVVAAGGAVIASWQVRPAWFPEELGWVVGCDYRGLPAGGPIRNPIGANMAVRRVVFTRVGGFYGGLGRDARRPLGCEETELAIRIRREAPEALVVRVAAAAVDHHVPRQRATLRYLLRRCWYEGISKGRLARRVGVGAGLASERRYVLRTLSGGAARHLAAAFADRDPAGPLRAALLVVATAVTTAGFVVGGR